VQPVSSRNTLPKQLALLNPQAFAPAGKESAGIAVVQAMNHQYHLQLAQENGEYCVRLLRYTANYALPPYIPGFTAETKLEIVVSAPWAAEEIVPETELHDNDSIFRIGLDEQHLTELARADGAAVNPEKVGCMTGQDPRKANELQNIAVEEAGWGSRSSWALA